MTISDVLRIDSKSFQTALILVCAFASSRQALSHDTWVETNTPIVHVNNGIYIDLCLGNHGNHHRDFKLAGKIDLKDCTLEVISPTGVKTNLLPSVIDMGLSPKEGYWKAKHVPADAGLFVVSHTCDKVVNHGRPLRSIKGAKAYFVASKSLDQSVQSAAPPSAVGHALEVVPLENPVIKAGAGQKIGVQILFKGKPLPDTVVDFIPRGETLKEGFDDRFEQKTDADGKAYFTPSSGNQILIVTRVTDENGKGPGYDATSYTATLTVQVPDRSFNDK